MFKKMLQKVKDWIAQVVCEKVVIGGHCGLCGKWVDICLVPVYRRVTTCRRCIDATEVQYKIVRRCLSKDHWQVWWEDKMVYESKSDVAEWTSGAFADGLERGITGSKHALYAKSKVKLEGFMSYLEAFASYEDYKGM